MVNHTGGLSPKIAVVIELGAQTWVGSVWRPGELIAEKVSLFGSASLVDELWQVAKTKSGFQVDKADLSNLIYAQAAEVITLDQMVNPKDKKISVKGIDHQGAQTAVVLSAQHLEAVYLQWAIDFLTSLQAWLMGISTRDGHKLVVTEFYLVGGGALLPGLASWLTKKLGVEVNVPAHPESFIVRQGGQYLKKVTRL